uniref:Neuropeptide F receptor n=2 Tax=Cacopsylla melanoneura TaxID=428564 RepID=A0A8D8YBN0_9HEMI
MISITQLENKYHTNYTIFNDINIIINFINYNNKTVSSATSHQCSTHITKQYTAGNLGENGTSDLAGNQGDQNEHVFQHMYLVITIAYYVLIMIVGLASNSLVSFIVMRQCTRKSMTNTGPSPRNLYIVNLSIADLALCALTIPFTILSLVNKSFIFNTILYKIMPLVQGANFMVTSGTITAIALDRYFTIVRSPHRKYCTCSVAAVITLIWLLSILSMIPTLIFDDFLMDKNLLAERKLDTILRPDNTVQGFQASLQETLDSLTTDSVSEADVESFGATICHREHPLRQFLLHVYVLVLVVVQFVVPVISLIFIHTKISSYLVQVHLRSPPVDVSTKRARREVRRNRRTMLILSCIAFVYLLSWAPFTMFTLCIQYLPYVFNSLHDIYKYYIISHCIAMTSTVTNPFLYGWLNTNFRREFRNVFYSLFNIQEKPSKKFLKRNSIFYQQVVQQNQRKEQEEEEERRRLNGEGDGGDEHGRRSGNRLQNPTFYLNNSMITMNERSNSYRTTTTTATTSFSSDRRFSTLTTSLACSSRSSFSRTGVEKML